MYSGGTDRPDELYFNFSISCDLTQMFNIPDHMVYFPTQIRDCDSCSLALLDWFLSFALIVCSTVAFPPLQNSDHIVVSASLDFPSNLKGIPLFIVQLMTILV